MEHINEQIRKTGALKRSILLDEPAVFGIKSLDQGMVIRAYDGLAKSGNKYLPGFSAVHEVVGRGIALQNGSKDPAEFWNENYNKPLARALAEFIAATGVAYDSPHSQNFLVELNSKNKPTGRIVLRDFGDSYLNTEFMSAVGRTDITKAWEAKNVLKNFMNASVGILHGNKAPTWIDMKSLETDKNSSYQKWGFDFYAEFQKEYIKQTGLNPFTDSIPNRSGAYFTKSISTIGVEGSKFIDLVKAGTQRENFKSFFCQRIFAM